MRGLTPLEHTAIDLALTATEAENEVPILPMVVDHILTPPATTPTVAWLKTDAWSDTLCGVWSPVTSPACSTAPPPWPSTRICR